MCRLFSWILCWLKLFVCQGAPSNLLSRWILTWTEVIWDLWAHTLRLIVYSIRYSGRAMVAKHNLAIVLHIGRDWYRRYILCLSISDILWSLHLFLAESIIWILAARVIIFNLPPMLSSFWLWLFSSLSCMIHYSTVYFVRITKPRLSVGRVDCPQLVSLST